MRFMLLASCATWSVLGGSVVAAQPAAVPDASQAATGLQTAAAAPAATDYHASTSADIVVTGSLNRDRRDILSGVSIMQGEELTQSIRPTIGETLARTPGVSATSFGPNASRPVLRGLQGERVRVLTDGIGSIDVSNTSVDHAVVIDPLLAERIEVLRGPEALLYGSSAIGGVVNVLDKRIPRAVPDEPVHIDAIANYASAANERSGGASVDVPLTSKIVVHADASYLKSDDLKIGGYVLSPQARAEALASARLPVDPDNPIDYAGNAALKGSLPNSSGKTWTVGAGAALITEGGTFGISYSHYDSVYGVPVRYATAPGQTEEAPRLDLMQNRLDARAEIDAGGSFIDTIRMRVGYANYRHFELEEDGSVGTAFYNKGIEGRVEVVQAKRGIWSGTSGVQYFSRDFNVVGDEAFLPRNETQQLGLFTLQQFQLGKFKLEAGGRYEHSQVVSQPTTTQPQFLDGSRSFDSLSGSLGASYALTSDWNFGVNLSHTVRAPSAEELFANGPHAGTEAFEIGDPDFKTERSLGLDGVLRGRGKGYTFEASVYYNWFHNFVYDDRTGAVEDGLPVYQSRQAKARYYGAEVQGTLTLATFGDVNIVADALADFVHADIVDVGPAPRIPPLRVLGGLGATSTKIDGRVELEWSAKQDRVSALETTTDSFKRVNAEINIRPWGTTRPLSFVLSANNIFDVDARRAASFLKDFAPLSGRDFRITARTTF
ncbi:TonB-dependent receptor [Glacieibacterium sp.]|uniref:TonB-dependent receptor n=1 Tax=Glacieibacterium sp. TaxID=2860237 RepID=UPI003B00D89C